MKKLIRNAAYAAAGLLAVSCSNDIPDNVTPVNRQDTGDGMYITLNLGTGTNGTRAVGDEVTGTHNASAAEAKINSIKIYLYNDAGLMLPIEFGSTQRYTDATTFAAKEEGFFQADDAEGPAETQVKIKVVKGTFEDFKTLGGANGSLNYFIACNYDTSLKNNTLDEIKAIDNIASRDDHDADFVMTATGTLDIATYETGKGLTAANPWNIVKNGDDIYVSHIEARCDFSEFTGTKAVDNSDNKVALTFDGVMLHNTTNTAYLLPRFFKWASSTYTFTDFKYATETNYVHCLSPAAPNATPYKYGDDWKGTNPFVTATDGTIPSKYITPANYAGTNPDVLKYNNVTYVAFRTYMTYNAIKDNFITDGEDAYVYAYEGKLIGSKSKLKDSSNTRLVAMYNNAVAKAATYTGDDKDNVDKALNDMYGNATGATKELRQYPKRGDNYYVYYNHPITRENPGANKETKHCIWYGVNANEIYDISVASFLQMGYPEGWAPDDINKEKTEYDFIQMNIKVKAWTKRDNAYDLE